MRSIQQLKQEKNELETFKGIILTFEEIAAMRMRKIRSSIIAYREFVLGLADIFHDVKASYKQQLLSFLKKKKPDLEIQKLLNRNGKTAAVLLSANTGLYGDIVSKTFAAFLDYVNTHQCDPVIIGRLGRLLFQRAYPSRKFEYLEVPDHGLTPALLQTISNFLIPYNDIIVFYGKFQSLSKQDPNMLSVYETEMGKQSPEKYEVRYMSEPSLAEINAFFEKEIFSSIIEQTLQESELAKLASRLYSLDMATDNLAKAIKKTEMMRRQSIHRITNQKQLSILSGMSLWNKS